MDRGAAPDAVTPQGRLHQARMHPQPWHDVIFADVLLRLPGQMRHFVRRKLLYSSGTERHDRL